VRAEQRGEPLEGHDRVEGGHLDADHARQVEHPVQRRVVVRHAPGRLVQPEGDHRQLAGEPRVVGHRVAPLGEGEERVGAAAAGLNRNWSSHLSGGNEVGVPIRDTNAQGQAIFHLSKDGSSLEYKLIASNIDNAFMAHIHIGTPDVNGPIAVWLFPSTDPTPGPLGSGRHDGVLAEGTITSANFVGPLAGQPMSALLTALESDNAYVNVHTNDGVGATNTGPGDFPGGEIRANVR